MGDAAMTEAELSTACGAAPELVRQLVALGVVPGRDGERPFVPGDIHRVRLAQAFERSGIPLEAIGAAVASGHLSFDADDAPTFSEWKAFFPPEALNEQLLTQGARLFGETTSRLADWGMALWQAYVAAPMLAAGMSAQEVMDASSAFAHVGTPMMERQLSWLLRRKLEHNTFQLIVEHVEDMVEAAGVPRPAPARLPAICFMDLSGYTALTEEIGDQAAAERAGTLGTLVQELAHGYGGRVVKLLGDGAMLLFPDPPGAVACGLELVERVEAAGLPPARVGIASGPVVFQDGDCYGRVVNVAARVMDRARPHQVLVTPEVVAATPAERARFRGLGAVELKGIAAAVELSAAAPPVDSG